jgi:PRTRC genetic system protein B
MTENTLHAKSCIYVYGDESGERYHLELHKVIEAGGKKLLGPARPLTKKGMLHLLKATLDDSSAITSSGGLIQDSVVAFDLSPYSQMLAWWEPAQARTVSSTSVQYPGGVYHQPPLLFIQKSEDLYVFALAKNRRPKAGTRLYHAPLFNISGEGKVCLGTAKIDKTQKQDMTTWQREWSAGFWESKFTHSSNPYLLHPKATLENVLDVARIQEFPVSALNPLPDTLQTVLDKLKNFV